MKQLERLLYLQGNRCFFCAQAIPTGEASVEHLVAAANGGAKDDENCVVCCKALNAALGHLSVKAKLQVVLNQRGSFLCPASGDDRGLLSLSTNPPDQKSARIAQIVADLRKRGSARPRRVPTLKNTMNSLFQMSLSDAELDALFAELKARGHVTVQEGKVSYLLVPSA